ncbi:hypothetical protein [Pyxidicoccus trucidator]|uniref:hypothetical protein n=1 Tax=Pyxidicoccus trucidator TaxID=2709662 RepID=UPI0013DA75D9|nr:hypothetical protein [Pyxidicoccus trucidator]
MARDSMQPWMDRLSLGELEVTGLSARSALGSRDWDSDALSYRRPANPDISAIPATVSLQVEDDTDDFDFLVASY